MARTLNLEHLSNEALMDRWTPTIFIPRNPGRLRDEVLRTNAEVERVLATRGITREA